MANSPSAAPAGQYRVIRIHGIVTECYITAPDPVTAKTLAQAQDNQGWYRRHIDNVVGTDTFEYDVVHPLSDDGSQT